MLTVSVEVVENLSEGFLARSYNNNKLHSWFLQNKHNKLEKMVWKQYLMALSLYLMSFLCVVILES